MTSPPEMRTAPDRFGRCQLRLGWLLLAVSLLAVQSPEIAAQIVNYATSARPEDPGLELLQQEPHDIVIFKQAAGGGWVKTVPLELPGRTVPADPQGALRFQVLGIEGQTFVANWSDIEQVALWELRLERETRERIGREDFQGAYPFLAVLMRDFPEREGIRELRCEFLWNDAVSRAKQGKLTATLAMLEELRRYAPDYRTRSVIGAIDRVVDRLMGELIQGGEPDVAQQLLARLDSDYQGETLASLTKWNNEFLKLAEQKRDQALAAIAAKDYRAARLLARESVSLKPDIDGGEALLRRIQQIYPLVRVGVLQTATELDPTRIDNWAARRSGRLIYRTLFEIEGAGPEGGEYDFIFGSVSSSPDRMQFELNLETERLEPPLNQIRSRDLADVLAARAVPDSPLYFAPWAAAVQTIGLNGPKQVTFSLRRPNVLPTALLQLVVDGSWFGQPPDSPTGKYERGAVTADEVRYVLSDAEPDATGAEAEVSAQPREIVETRCASAADGVNLLLQGEIDVLDQLFPADAVRLQRSNRVRVNSYPLPTVHLLVPWSDHPYLAERTFRRALLYGTNRQDILNGELLEGLESPGCRVLSGPFPAGLQPNDPLGYAYDEALQPRPYEPPLARLLIAITVNQLKDAAERDKEPVPDLTPLRIALPSDNLSRVACEAIKTQWELIGLQVELVELPVGKTQPEPEEDIADLVYMAAAIWEPVIDARRLLGPQGIAGSTDQLVGLGLRRIEEARNWSEVRNGLLNLHSIAHHELPVLPLWQMVDSYAYRRELTGIGSDIVSLYQNAKNWRMVR